MEQSVESIITNCSTPLFEDGSNQPDFPPSEIRRNKTLLQIDVVTVRKKPKPKPKQRRRRNGKENADPDTDSAYKTIDVYETHSEESEIVSESSRNFQDAHRVSNNQLRPSKNIADSSNLSPKLFSPLTEDEYMSGYYNNPDLQEEAPSPSFLSPNQTIGSPVFQQRFNDPTKYTTYFKPEKKTKLSPSPSSPRNEALWCSKTFSYRANQLWEEFTKNNTNNSVERLSGSKYSHTADRYDRCERFVGAVHGKQGTIRELELLGTHRKKKAIQMSPTNERISGKNCRSLFVNPLRVRNSYCKDLLLKSSTEKRLKPLEQTFEKLSFGCSSPQARSVSEKSKPQIISNAKVNLNIGEFKKLLLPKK